MFVILQKEIVFDPKLRSLESDDVMWLLANIIKHWYLYYEDVSFEDVDKMKLMAATGGCFYKEK